MDTRIYVDDRNECSSGIGNSNRSIDVMGKEEIQELIELAKPKKVIKYKPKRFSPDRWLCPTCEYDIYELESNYCSSCGQALDWSEYVQIIKGFDKDSRLDERQGY